MREDLVVAAGDFLAEHGSFDLVKRVKRNQSLRGSLLDRPWALL